MGKIRPAILAIDQGTTGSRAILYSANGKSLASAYREFRQFYPRPGFVEHDAQEIWRSVSGVIQKVLSQKSNHSICAIGITNQRETTVLWDRRSGKPVAPAIVWQDRRTSDLCGRFKQQGRETLIRKKTGLVLDPYFSATKLAWMLNHDRGLRQKARRGDILFGTIDSWLIWKLTGGKVHATDATNASRTLLFNIHSRSWDLGLLDLFGIPKNLLPQVLISGSHFGKTDSLGLLPKGVPIEAVMGDQQAALYGQGCYRPGQAKNTYGTGCFIVMNLGSSLRHTPKGLLATLACDQQGKTVYALEGSVFIAGAAIQWLRDGLKFFRRAQETEKLIRGLRDTGGVTFIPAFVGLGSPYWNPYVRGIISGITRGTRREHIIRAALEALAHQTADVVEHMEKELGRRVPELRVDGGATANRFLMQFQADLLRRPILVSDIAESTAWGVAKLAGVRYGLWKDPVRIDRKRKYKRFQPHMKSSEKTRLRQIWKREMARLLLG